MKVLNRDFRSSVKGHYCAALSSPPQITIFFCTKRDTKLVNDTQQSTVVVVEPLLVVPCIACRISLLPRPSGLSAISRPFRIEGKLALRCLNTQTTLQYKPQKRATKMIVTILIGINACNNNISINNKREGWITSCLGG